MENAILLWNDWQNAEIYQAYTQEFPIYRVLNRHLVELAQVESARRVLDLACGSGATAQSCLRRLPMHGELVGVDTSAAMVGVAESWILDARARFLVAPAECLDQEVEGPFDRVLCNAAFWQLPNRRKVLADLARLMSPGALFVFNIPADRLRGEESAAHPFQEVLGRLLENRSAEALVPAARQLDEEGLKERLDNAGFELLSRERFTYSGTQEELAELMEIPVMLASAAPELSCKGRREALRIARETIDEDHAVTVPWIFFVARRV
jgi:ubiquinone/menaquinone biosynthesis C-methylase UbiE